MTDHAKVRCDAPNRQGNLCDMERGHSGNHWTNLLAPRKGCPCCGKCDALEAALILAKRQRDRAILYAAQRIEPGWHPDQEGPYT